MVTSNKSNLKGEKRLVEEVQKSLCLYDESNESYKEKKKRKKAYRLGWRMPSVMTNVHNDTVDVFC